MRLSVIPLFFSMKLDQKWGQGPHCVRPGQLSLSFQCLLKLAMGLPFFFSYSARMLKKLLPFLGLAALALIGWFFFFAPGGVTVTTIKPHRGTAVQAAYATGTVEASVMIPIAARGTARLMEMAVDEGSTVAKDQVLARLEDRDLQEALAEATAREDYARKVFESYAKLVQKGTVTRRAYDQAEADVNAAKAAVSRLSAQADFMKLVAPADGTIIRRDGEVGELIAANKPVFWLSCCAPLRISAEVDEEDIPLVQTGQRVLIRADAYPGKIFEGKVQGITPKGDAVSRSYRVRISLDGDTPLKIGMTAETNIILEEKKDALLVPASAMSDGAVWLVKNGVAQRQAVETGIKGLEDVEVLSGLTEGDVLAQKPDKKWSDGMKVRGVPARQGKK